MHEQCGEQLPRLDQTAAPLALWRRPQRRVLGRTFNALGLLDLVVALSAGALLAPGALQAVVTDPTTEAMTRLPLVLIPTFAVPIAIVLHVASFRLLAQSRQLPRAGRPAMRAGSA